MLNFEAHRHYLFAIAYRMTGSAADAEDLVQETWLRAQRAETAGISNERAWLARVITRLALDLLKSAQRTREEYIGPWLPEPIVAHEREEDLETVSFAFMTILERLTPEERAVLLLRDVFHYEFDEIAEIVSKEASNCRQILHRARARIEESKPRFRASPEEHRRLVDGFIASVQAGDPAGLERLLAPGVTSWSDGGGKVNAARRPIVGRDHVIRFLAGLARLAPPDVAHRQVVLNGAPGIATFVGGQLFNTISFDVEDGLITALRFVVNPDKLRTLRRQLDSMPS